MQKLRSPESKRNLTKKIAAANLRSEEISAEANRKAGELKQQNLITEAKLEDERKTRLELEKSLAPRVLVIRSDAQGRTNLDGMTPFAGIQAIIEYLPDPEVARTAQQIASAVVRTGWKVVGIVPKPDMNASFFDGVKVTPYAKRGPDMPTREEDKQGKWCLAAASSLVEVLRESGWQATIFPAGKDELPFNTVKIRVGLKPNPYFSPVKDIEERFGQEEDKYLKRLREEFTPPTPPK
jgi:hypothetical protein